MTTKRVAAGQRNALVAMSTTAVAGATLMATAWLATRRLTPEELGFFFTFLSFGALVQMADFGLPAAALQTAGTLAGTGRLQQLGALADAVRKWNIAVSGLVTGSVAVVGWILFSRAGLSPGVSDVPWKGPWIAFLLGSLATQLAAAGIGVREGSGKIAQMWWLRLLQETAGGGACLATLYFGGGLWSLCAFAAARGLLALFWLLLGDPLRRDADLPPYTLERWMKDVWPFQWKMGLSRLSGFLIFRAFSPLILLENGPTLAGQFGLAIAVTNLLISVTTAWPASQAARWAAFIAGGRGTELRRVFRSLLGASTVFSATAAMASTWVFWRLRVAGFPLVEKLTDPVTTGLLLTTAVVHHFVGCVAVLLRAEGREPLLWPSVIGGVVTIVLLWLAAHWGGSLEIATTNLLCSLAGIPVVLVLLKRRSRYLWPPS